MLDSAAGSTDLDDADDDDEAGGDDVTSNASDDRAGSHACFEKRIDDLEPLPKENNPEYPQENAAYIAKQKRLRGEHYVRSDKYSLKTICELCSLLNEDAKLPSIMSAYQNK